MIYLHMKKDCFNMFVIYNIFVKSKKSRKNQKIVVQI